VAIIGSLSLKIASIMTVSRSANKESGVADDANAATNAGTMKK
jgi:hypothetical protein